MFWARERGRQLLGSSTAVWTMAANTSKQDNIGKPIPGGLDSSVLTVTGESYYLAALTRGAPTGG